MKRIILLSFSVFILFSCSAKDNKSVYQQDITNYDQVSLKEGNIEHNSWTIVVENIVWSWIVISNNNENIVKKSDYELSMEEKEKIRSFSDISECQDLKYKRLECEDKFTFNLAEENKSIKYCLNIKQDNLRQICRDNISYYNKDCSLISDTYLKDKCNLEVNKNIKEKTISNTENCNLLASYTDKMTCAQKQAIKLLDYKLCNKYFSWDDLEICYKGASYKLDKAIIRKALNLKDINICNNIYSIGIKEQCKLMKF